MDELKERKLTDKEIKFYEALKGKPEYSFILLPEKVINNIGYFHVLSEGDLLGKDKKYFLLAAEAIAKFHHHQSGLKINYLSQNSQYYSESLKNTLKYAKELGVELPQRQIQELQAELATVDKFGSVVHDDFFPKNILVDGDDIKIIDWEDMKYGFAEADIGRFLGDLDAVNPNSHRKYYPSEWHDEIQDMYLKTRHKLNKTYDIKHGADMIRLGEMWNYLGPIEMCLQRKKIDDPWFLENLQALAHS